LTTQDEDLARRVYAYFIFRLRQPADAERLTRLTFDRVRDGAKLSRDAEREPDLPVLATARAVIADNPRARGASKAVPARPWDREQGPTGLSKELAVAIGRLHGRERDALALRFGAELSIGEIAELLDRTPADVKQRLARGVRALISLGVLPEETKPRRPAPRRSAAKRPGARGAKKGKRENRQAGDEGSGDAKG
jgi:DNA-directed RNA polymerase specialized sigma24 family protein